MPAAKPCSAALGWGRTPAESFYLAEPAPGAWRGTGLDRAAFFAPNTRIPGAGRRWDDVAQGWREGKKRKGKRKGKEIDNLAVWNSVAGNTWDGRMMNWMRRSRVIKRLLIE